MATLLDRVRKAEEDKAWREEQQRITESPEEAKRQADANREMERQIREMEEKRRQQGGGEQKG